MRNKFQSFLIHVCELLKNTSIRYDKILFLDDPLLTHL